MEDARNVGILVVLVLASVVLTGGLGDPPPGGFVRFDDIRREAFTAIAVQRGYDGASDGPLTVRLNIIGDAKDADVSQALQWLRDELDIRVVRTGYGAPLYLTEDNLIATSGPSALGATVRAGMVVETRDAGISPCVVAHELLHFLGLHHVDDPKNIMYPRCASGKLATASLSETQRDELARLTAITAVTPAGIVTWASR